MHEKTAESPIIKGIGPGKTKHILLHNMKHLKT